MIELQAMVRDAHQNAVDHGFYDEKRPMEERLANIHCEWSEAMSEYARQGPLYWHRCPHGGRCETQEVHGGETDCAGCTPAMRKPEGVAVELMDGCLRILDLAGYLGLELSASQEQMDHYAYLPNLVASLHYLTSMVYEHIENGDISAGNRPLASALLMECVLEAFDWVRHNDADPVAILLEKHEYNKTRPYMHGKIC